MWALYVVGGAVVGAVVSWKVCKLVTNGMFGRSNV
jgi:hypothetical protein